MKIIIKLLEKIFLYCCLPSDSVFNDSISKYIGCSSEVLEHGKDYVNIRLIEEDETFDVRFKLSPLSYDNNRYVITKIEMV